MIDWLKIYEQIAPLIKEKEFFKVTHYYYLIEYAIGGLALSFVIFNFLLKNKRISKLQYPINFLLLGVLILPFFYNKGNKLEIKLMVANGVFTGERVCYEPIGGFDRFFADSIFQVFGNGIKYQENKSIIEIRENIVDNMEVGCKIQLLFIKTSDDEHIPLLIFDDNKLIYRNKNIIVKEIKVK